MDAQPQFVPCFTVYTLMELRRKPGLFEKFVEHFQSAAVSGIERYELPDSAREDYLSAYEGDRFVESMRYVRAYPKELPILAELLPQIETPVEIIGGLWDWAVPPSNHRYLHQRLPKSKLDLIDAGHFTWEDAPEEYAEIVTSWWAGGHAEV